MNQIKNISCSVCLNENTFFFIETNALMHKQNNERYIFNKCLKCESIFLTNPVENCDLDKYYTDNYLPYKGPDAWGKYKSFVANSQKNLDLKRVKFVSGFIKNNQNASKILDVGCGNPSFLEQVIKKLNIKATGIDFSDNGWKNSKFENIELIKTSIENFDTKDTFDIITLWHYLEHDYNLQETVNKLYKCLNVGGKLIIEVPNFDSISAKKQKQFWQGWHSPRHITLFSKKGFQILFPIDKWSIIKHLEYGTLDAFTLWWLGKMEQKKINWSSNMEREFWPLVFFKIISLPFFVFEKFFSMGIQLIVIEKK